VEYTPRDISAVVCTMNSIKSIEVCLQSLRDCGVGEIIVVDANSQDGTRQIVDKFADQVLTDPGIGLGVARNLGISQSKGSLVFNFGSDNVIRKSDLERMIQTLSSQNLAGVSAQTRVKGRDYLAQCMNAWWQTRFQAGPAHVIGTPSLFVGEVLRENPFDTSRQHSDDSELCERWSREFGAQFAISEAIVYEVGKNEWSEVALRCRNYGFSDYEIFSEGSTKQWTRSRKIQSLLHPFKVDFVQPVTELKPRAAVQVAPFLAAFTTLRYTAWARKAIKNLF